MNILVISWRSVLLMVNKGISGEKKNRPIASNRQTLSHNVESSTCLPHTGIELITITVIGTDFICTNTCRYKFNYHTVTDTTTLTVCHVMIIKMNVKYTKRYGFPSDVQGCYVRGRTTIKTLFRDFNLFLRVHGCSFVHNIHLF